MKPISDTTMNTLEELALEGAKQLRAFFAYQGENPIHFQKAKLGAVVISGFGRVRQSETGRMAVELSAQRAPGMVLSGGAPPAVSGEENG